MKKITIAILALCCYSSICHAQGAEVTLNEIGPVVRGGPRKYEIPPIHVYNDGEDVTISSDSTQTVGVVIRSIEGSLLYQGVVDTSSNGTSLYVPSQPMDEKYSIDLYTEEQHLMGYF